MIVQFAFPVHALQRHDVSAVASGHPLHFLSLAVFHNHFFFFPCGKAGSRTPWQSFGKRTAISRYYKPPLRFGIAVCRGLSSISIDGLPSQWGGGVPPTSLVPCLRLADFASTYGSYRRTYGILFFHNYLLKSLPLKLITSITSQSLLSILFP